MLIRNTRYVSVLVVKRAKGPLRVEPERWLDEIRSDITVLVSFSRENILPETPRFVRRKH